MSNAFNDYWHRLEYRLKVMSRFFGYNMIPNKKRDIINNFHKLYYDAHITGGTWHNTFFLGVPVQKCPLDLHIYQEIIYEVKPDIIIEAGTANGGGAYFLASICDLLGHGEVVTIDVQDFQKQPKHKRITFLKGSSTEEKIIKLVKNKVKGKKRVLVILDSDHSFQHVYNETQIYHKFVTKGSYMIVEDGNVNGNPVYKDHGPGPMEAIKKFLKNNKEFQIDKTKEKFYLTFNPSGYLKKI